MPASAAEALDLYARLDRLFAAEPEIRTLENGLTLVFQPDPTHPLLSCQVWIRTGSIHEEEHLGRGLSHFLEHMVFKGTERRGPGRIPEEVQSFGGHLNAYTSFDRTVYHIDGPAEKLAASLDLLADLSLHPVFPEEELRREKEVVLREIDMTVDDPDRTLARTLFRTAFREHPVRFPVIGLRPLFEEVDRGMVAAYHRRRYLPGNIVLAICGAADREAVVAEAEATFGKVPLRAAHPVVIPPEPPQLAMRKEVRHGDYQLCRGMMAWKIPSLRGEGACGLDILAAIIGAGQSGRLRQRLRDELGLVYNISAGAWNPRDPGLFLVSYQCDPGKAEEVEKRIRETCEGYAKEAFSEKEVEKARRFAFVSEIQARQTVSGRASRLGLLSAIVRDENYPRRYFATLKDLTGERLRVLAEKTFRTEKLNLVRLQPEGRPARSASPGNAHSEPRPFEELQLPNGARLLYQADPRLPRTFLRFAGRGGPLLETKGKEGSAALLAAMMTRDTSVRSAAELAAAIEDEGGFLQEAAGNNSFAIAAEVLPDRAEDGLHLLREAVLQPAFRPETFERERESQLAHLREQEDDIIDFGRSALRRAFFADHPFAHDTAGTTASVEALCPDDLRALHRRLVTGPNAVLVLTGDFDPARLLPHARDFLAGLPNLSPPSDLTRFLPPEGPREVTESLPREQAVLFEAYPDAGFTEEDDLAGELLDEILSDMAGPLFRNVREEKSLAYFVGAARISGPDFGAFCLYAGTRPDAGEAVFAAFSDELDRIRKGGLREEELQAAKTRLLVRDRFSLQSPSARAARAARNTLFGMPAMDWLDFEERLQRRSLADLRAYARCRLRPEHRLRLTVRPD
ncbi:MAG: insulinase family protein [Verrucomicrobia bacterium]|jgi:zinc protease|nr:insulinase family protein [Verrucomicrobiota bacterium]